jgi:hypothetical protein
MTCRIEPLPFLSGKYNITLALSRPGIAVDLLENAVSLDIHLPYREGMLGEYKRSAANGCIFVEHHWEKS